MKNQTQDLNEIYTAIREGLVKYHLIKKQHIETGNSNNLKRVYLFQSTFKIVHITLNNN